MNLAAVLAQPVIFRNRVNGALLVGQHFRVNRARHQKIGIDKGVELHHGTNQIVIGIGQHHYLTLCRFRYRLGRWCSVVRHRGEFRTGKNPAGGIDHEHGGQRAHRCLCHQIIGEALAGIATILLLDQRRGTVDVIGHGEDVATDDLAVLLHISARDADRIFQRRLHPLGEPRLHTQVQRHGSKHRYKDRRQHRNRAEHRDKAHMQPGTRGAGAPCTPQPHQPPGDQRAQGEHQGQIDEKQDHQPGRRRVIGNQPGNDGIGRSAGGDRHQADRERQQRRPGDRLKNGQYPAFCGHIHGIARGHQGPVLEAFRKP